MSQDLWLVSTPVARSIRETLTKAIEDSDCGRVFLFDTPPLNVGSLNSIVAMSDDVNKINTQVENVLKKVERQFSEVKDEDDKLKVAGVAIGAYLRKFKWDYAQYACQGKPLTELTSKIHLTANEADVELKKIVTLLSEKTTTLAGLQRRKQINYSTSDLEDLIPPERFASLDIVNTPSLLTVFVVVPAASLQEFQESYDSLGSNIAAYNSPDWSSNMGNVGKDDDKYGPRFNRLSKTGSPIVPNSLKVVLSGTESTLCTITVLKGHTSCGTYNGDDFIPGKFIDYLEPLKSAFREKRLLIRPAVYDRTKAVGLDRLIENASKELDTARKFVVKTCLAHFGNVFNGWIHLKVIKAFVEAVLRYGLPANYMSLFIYPNPKREKQLKALLTDTITSVCPSLVVRKMSSLEADEEEDDVDNLPYVCMKFTVVGLAPV